MFVLMGSGLWILNFFANCWNPLYLADAWMGTLVTSQGDSGLESERIFLDLAVIFAAWSGDEHLRNIMLDVMLACLIYWI